MTDTRARWRQDTYRIIFVPETIGSIVYLSRHLAELKRNVIAGFVVTCVGDDNWIMAYVHLAHDCQIANHTIFANNTQLAGHVHVGDWVILGGFTVVHQFCRLGAHSFTAMNSLLFADLPPFVMCQGQPAQARSMNFEGLRRRGFDAESIRAVKAMHKLLYRDGLTLAQAQGSIAELARSTEQVKEVVELMTAFLDQADPQRGIVR